MDERILVVEDDQSLQEVISNFLKDEGYITELASTGSKALAIIDKLPPSLVLLDLGLPDIQGDIVLKNIRGNYPELPVIILTAKSKPEEIAEGLNLGANDYLSKPFAAEELLARINARLKRPSNKNDLIVFYDLTVDLSKIKITRAGKNIDLTKTEFELLKFLLENKGKVLSRDVILNNVWGYSSNVESRVVDIYIGYLRKKIDKGFGKKLIKNRRGFGYLIE